MGTMDDEATNWTPPWKHGAGSKDAGARRGEQTLISSASTWMQEALEAWSEDGYKKSRRSLRWP